LTVGGLVGVVSPVARGDVLMQSAFDNSTVKPTGPRTGTNNQKFLNIEGNGNGTNASFGVADFHGTGFTGPVTTLNSVQLQLTQSNAAFTHTGALNFYLSRDTTTGVDTGTTPAFLSSALPDGIGTQLTPYDLIGTGTFTQGTINTNGSGTVDTYTLNLPAADQSYLIQQLNNGGNIRILVAPGDDTVAATYAGFANTSTAPVTPGPVLLIDSNASTPEPAAPGLIALGAVGLIRRRGN
jgi:MYXO-CTERM domain-containing protein